MSEESFPDERLILMILDIVGAVQALSTGIKIIALSSGVTEKQREALGKITARADQSEESVMNTIRDIIGKYSEKEV